MNTLQKKQILKNRFSLLAVLLFVYIVLFEFVLPVNKVLPKPSLLLDSLPALFEDYNLLAEMAISTTVIYLSIAVAYFLVQLFSFQLDKINKINPGLFNNFKLFKNFPAFFFAVLFAFWFSDSIVMELVFAILASTFFMIVKYLEALKTVEDQYLLSAKSLSLSEKEIHKSVTWKYIQPQFFSELKRLHYYLWVLILIYEFIGGLNGFGGIYKFALEYQDFSAIVLLGIIIALLIWLGNAIIDFVKNRIVFWKV